MKRFCIAAMMGCLALSACGPDKPADTNATAGGNESLTSDNTAGGAPPAAPSPTAPQSDNAASLIDMPIPPPGAHFTILCTTFTGDNHIADANNAREDLIRGCEKMGTWGVHGWYVVHSADESDLYFGFYKTIDDKSQTAEYKRFQDDCARLKMLVDASGSPIFKLIAPGPIPTADPAAPKDWDLNNCKGYWTLQVGIYKNDPRRKQFAVDAVREMRAHGIEAYFHHGDLTSEVCIGAWPRDAAQISSPKPSNAAGAHPLYLPALPPGADPDSFRDREGNPMQVIVPTMTITDPTLKAAIAKYPYTETNGRVLGRAVAGPNHTQQVIPNPSFLVKVPHADDQGAQQAEIPHDNGISDDHDIQQPIDPGMGNLKSIGN